MFGFFNKKSADPELTPREFTTQMYQVFVKYFTDKGYLDNIAVTVPEVANWVNEIPLKALKNQNIVKLSKGNPEQFYFYAGSLSFAYASYLVGVWNDDFGEFSTTNYKTYGLSDDYETAMNNMNIEVKNKKGEIISAQVLVDDLIGLLGILNSNLQLFGNIRGSIYKDYIYAGMQAFFLLGMSTKLYSIGLR